MVETNELFLSKEPWSADEPMDADCCAVESLEVESLVTLPALPLLPCKFMFEWV